MKNEYIELVKTIRETLASNEKKILVLGLDKTLIYTSEDKFEGFEQVILVKNKKS